ncbi:MAG: hypothetical protein QNK05_24060 [Myxococcota bacterium]|nr:hypothetical protein [Myxococcota bacterium]
MAQPQIIQDVSDRVENAVKTFEKDLKKLQKDADKRRKAFEKRAEREVKKLQKQIDAHPVVKRAKSLRSDAVKTAQGQLDSLLGTFRIASQGEVERLEKKIGTLSRKLRAVEKNQAA